MMEIRRIGVLSTAKMFGALYLALGLIVGFIFACMGLVTLAGVSSAFGSDVAEVAGGGVGMFIGACFFPIMYGIIGAVAGAIMAALYNLIAGWIGGIELEFAGGKPEA